MANRIELLIDIATSKASGAVRGLSKDLAQADGAFAKTKVAAGGIFDSLKANAVLGVAAVGSAVAGFAGKAIGDFQKTALGAGKLSDSLGVTTEEASRLQEVAGDVGVNVGALESTIGRMNRVAASTPGAFDEIGASIVRNRDGTVNVTETFLSAIDALNKMPDATKRAAAAQKIFGRGWQEISELVATGADGVREALAGVESQKVIDEGEVAQARKFRDALDELKGAGEAFTIWVGQNLVPALTGIKGALEPVGRAFKWLGDDLQAAEDKLDSLTGQRAVGSLAEDFAEGWRQAQLLSGALGAIANGAAPSTFAELATATEAVGAAAGAAIAPIEDEAKAIEDAASAAERSAAAHDAEAAAILDSVSARRAAADAQFALGDAQRQFVDDVAAANTVLADQATTLPQAAAAMDVVAQSAGNVADAAVRVYEETAASNGATLTAAQTGDVWRNSMLEQAAAADGPLREGILSYVGAVEEIPPEKLSEIKAAIARGDLAAAVALLDGASEKRTAEMEADAETKAAESDLNRAARARTSFLTGQAITGAAEGAFTRTIRSRTSFLTGQAITGAAEGALNRTSRGRVASILGQGITGSAEGALNRTARSRAASIAASASTGNAESALNNVARNRTSTVTVYTRNVMIAVADGAVFARRMADGAVSGIRSLANGDATARLAESARVIARPTQAMIQKGAAIIFGEPETHGESFIPHARSKRSRSIELWKQTGRILGVLADGEVYGGATPGGSSRVVQLLEQIAATAGPRVNLTINNTGKRELDYHDVERALRRVIA